MGDEARIVESAADHAIGAWRDAVIVVWRGAVHDAALDAIDRTTREVAHARDARVGLLVFIEDEASAPEDGARDAIGDVLRRSEGHVGAMATVFDAGGLRGAAARGMATWLSLVHRLAFAQRTFGAAGDAIAWLGTHLDGGPADGELATALEAVRSAPIE